MKKRIVFLTGTRADFGKLKSLIEITRNQRNFEVYIFATGMHMDIKYGYTVREIEKCGYDNIYKYINHDSESIMDITLSRTIEGFANYARMIEPDLIVVHGDRIEALAGATVGALNNILVAHVEGGELSGTVDELIRHAVSKLSHTHFVANEEAKKRLIQMGELEESVYVIGSPDMDVMLSENLPGIDAVKEYYEIGFENYALSIFHPVTTESELMHEYAANYFEALAHSGLNYVAIYPNNDKGSDIIMQRVKKLQQHSNFKIFPSVRFEYFLTLLKHASFIIGNSSAGIREAPYYGVHTVNVGTRQNGRSRNPHIINTSYEVTDILKGLRKVCNQQRNGVKQQLFGNGKSASLFSEILSSKNFWETKKQKAFKDAASNIVVT
jgi:UDP-N-acetylglucosamine 2-epimerase (hydrolysing)